jgi:hypothetical protein
MANKHILSYDETGNLTKVEDALGRALRFSYQGSRLTGISDGYGRTYSFAYSGETLTSLTDPLGKTRCLAAAIPAPELISTVTCPRGNQPYTQSYDSQGR